jgi:hypothetical protein
MTRMLAAVLFALTIGASASAPAFAQTPPSALITSAQALLSAPAGQTADPDALMTPDAVVIDEVDPFVWSGPHAASQWVAAVKKEIAAHHVTAIAVTTGKPVEYVEGAGAAYLILPVSIALTVQPKSITEAGFETLTFRQVGSDWKISSAVWTTAPAP